MTRTVGVEEEFLLVSPDGRHLVAAGDQVAALTRKRTGDDDAAEHELKREQAETGSPPAVDLAEVRAHVAGRRRALAAAAASVGARIAALGCFPGGEGSTVTDEPRYRELVQRFGRVAGGEQLTCGQHVHVGVDGDDEAIAVLDRLQLWLPALRAITGNSPIHAGRDTDYASYRTVLWGRWPTAGPTAPFGDMTTYRATLDALVASGAALDEGAIYFDARPSASFPTVEVRVADVSLDVDRAVALAAIARALVERCAQDWRDGRPLTVARPELLRGAHWVAARYGVSADLVVLPAGSREPAFTVLERLVGELAPALTAAGDEDAVAALLTALRENGTGADEQRRWWQHRPDIGDLVTRAVERTEAG